jgi:hypothetical protein
MKFLADAFWFQRTFTEYLQSGVHQSIVGEYRSPPSNALLGKYGNERVHAVLGLNLIGPSAFWCAPAQTRRFYFHDFHSATVALNEWIHMLIKPILRRLETR